MPTGQNLIRKLRAMLPEEVRGCAVIMKDDTVRAIETVKTYRQIMSECAQKRVKYSRRSIEPKQRANFP